MRVTPETLNHFLVSQFCFGERNWDVEKTVVGITGSIYLRISHVHLTPLILKCLNSNPTIPVNNLAVLLESESQKTCESWNTVSHFFVFKWIDVVGLVAFFLLPARIKEILIYIIY